MIPVWKARHLGNEDPPVPWQLGFPNLDWRLLPCPSMTPLSPLCLLQMPGQVVLTFHKIALLDEKNVYFTQDSKLSPVDCIPRKNENPSVEAFQSWNKSELLGYTALFCQFLSFSRSCSMLRQIRGDQVRTSSLYNHKKSLQSGNRYLLFKI